jgi:hypothetical protein
MYFATTDNFNTAGAKTRMMIDHSGNVGIGTTTPAGKFNVSAGSDTTALVVNLAAMDPFLHRWSNPLDLKMGIGMVIILIWQCLTAGRVAAFSPEKAGFLVKFKDEVSSYRVNGVFVLPHETLVLEALDAAQNGHYVLQAAAGKVTQVATNRWHWQALGKPGLYPVRIIHPQSAEVITLNIFVLIPYNPLKGKYLNGYRIGSYPRVPLKRLPIYKPPKGLIEVTKDNEETLVAPHFQLKQFLCKQEGNYPKYVVLRERLLLKLELILEKVNQQGYYCHTLHIMSGYRTPAYNQALGNGQYSRHLWGDAADIFIDENPRDGMMDDLNQDGKINYQDAALLYHIIDDLHGRPFYQLFVGGLGGYERTAFHGPFVHVDTRGFRARW